MASELKERDFDKKVIKSDKLVLVDFYAPWCGPCQALSPIIEEVAKEVGDKAIVYKVNIDDEHALANKFQVMSIPTLIVFKDGKIKNQIIGLSSKEDLVSALTKK